MFEWFFGNPKKEELRDYGWLRQQLEKTPISQKELEEIFSGIKTVIKNLNKAALKLYLKDEDIIEKCQKLSVEILQHKSVEEIKRGLGSYEGSLRKHLENILEAIKIAKKEGGFPQQIFSNFKGLIEDDLKGIAGIINELIKIYDFLEHIHLSPEEVEFYIMRKRGKTKKIDDLTFYIKWSEYIIYQISGKEINKKGIAFITGTKELNYPLNKSGAHTSKHLARILPGLGTPRGSQFLKMFDEVSKSIEEIWRSEAKTLASNPVTWRRPVIVFERIFSQTVGMLRGNAGETNRLRVELNLGAGKFALLHGYPY